MRVTLSVVVGAAVAALGALILGEYEFDWLLAGLGGPLFGLVVAEVVTAVGAWRGPAPAGVAAALAAGGLGWAAWITSGRGLEPFPALAWVAVALAVVAAVAWAGPTRGGARRGGGDDAGGDGPQPVTR